MLKFGQIKEKITDQDLAFLRSLSEGDDNSWTKVSNKLISLDDATIWQKSSTQTNFNMFKVKVACEDVSAEQFFNTLRDDVYRFEWDDRVDEMSTVCKVGDNSDIIYLAMRMPPPLK